MKELTEIGTRVNNAIEAVWKTGLSVKEIERLEEYLGQQEAILPLTDPIFIIQKNGFKLIDQAKKRIELLKPIIQLKENQNETKTKLTHNE